MGTKGRLGWGIIIAAAVLVIYLGSLGYSSIGFSPINALYASLQLFAMEASFGPRQAIPLSLHLARILAPVVMAATAIRTATLLLKKEIAAWKLSHLNRQIVICGLSRYGYELARRCREAELPVVILEEDENNNYITACEIIGCHVLVGDAMSATLLGKSRVHYASELFLMTGDDGTNISTLMKTVELFDRNPDCVKQLKVWLQIDAVDICAFLRNEGALVDICRNIDVEVISLQEVVARSLIIKNIYPILPVSQGDDRNVHLAIAGLGKLGKTLITRTIRMLVLPNSEARLKITVIDRDAEASVANLRSEYPHLTDFCDLNVLEGDMEYAVFRKKIADCLDDQNSVAALILCTKDAYLNMSSAMHIAENLWSKSGFSIPVFVRLSTEEGWAGLLEAHKCADEWTNLLVGYGAVSDICNKGILTQDMLDKLACAMHEYYCLNKRDKQSVSDVPWSQLHWIYKDSNRQAADHIHLKLRSIGLDLEFSDEPSEIEWPPPEPVFTSLAKLEHRRWCVERRMAGWKFGEVTDRKLRISQDLVDWDSLADEAKQKDYEHIRVYPEVLKRAGMRIVSRASG